MYLVTGASGNVGAAVVSQLLAAGAQVRVLTRRPESVAPWGDRVQVVVGGYEDAQAVRTAATGVEGAFLMDSGAELAPFANIVTALAEAGRPNVVFLSTLLAGAPGFLVGDLHLAKEKFILDAGLPANFVRPGAFMSNAFAWIASIASQGIVYNATGEGRSAPIAPSDVAACVAVLLRHPKPSGAAFEVTGGELSNTPELVRVLGHVLKRDIACIDVPMEAAVQGLLRSGLSPRMAQAVVQSLEATRDNLATYLSDNVEKLTGRAPTTFQAWSEANASRFVAATA